MDVTQNCSVSLGKNFRQTVKRVADYIPTASPYLTLSYVRISSSKLTNFIYNCNLTDSGDRWKNLTTDTDICPRFLVLSIVV